MATINRDKEKLLDWDYLYSILDYDEDTGIFRWKVSKAIRTKIGSIAGTIGKQGYRQIIINNVIYKAHRLAWFYTYAKWPNKFIDHIDGIRDNNAINNLREASNQENLQNKKKVRKDTASGSSIPGVYFNKAAGKYVVHLYIAGKQKHFGCFTLLEEAETECIRLRRIYYPFNTL